MSKALTCYEIRTVLTIEDDQVRLAPMKHGVSRAQAPYREHARQARTTDDFLVERNAEAAADPGETVSDSEAGGAR